MGSRLGVLLVVALAAGCNYGFQGGGGLPSHIQTVYIQSFENETVQFGLEQRLEAELLEALPSQLGVRAAGRESADAIVRGRITRYDDVAQNYRSDAGGGGRQVLQHQVHVGAAIEIIDVERNVILWESSGITGLGVYDPSEQSDDAARQEAVRDLVRKIIDGAQSQW